jgi:uncharacterized protein (TIGR03382 family)
MMRGGLWAALLCLGGCTNEVGFADEFSAAGTAMEGPYLVGSEVTVETVLPGRLQGDEGLSLRSTNTDVFAVVDQVVSGSGLTGILEGISEGTARLEVYKKDRLIDDISVTFTLADDVAFFPGALERIGFEDEADPMANPKVVRGGLASFRVQLLADGSPVYGDAILSVTDAADTVTVQVDEYYGDVLGPWVWIEPTENGTSDVTVEVNNNQELTFGVTTVAITDLASIRLRRQSELTAKTGAILGVTAVGTTIDGDDVYGLPVDWQLDGTSTEDWGEDYFDYAVVGPETFWYEYDPELPRMLQAELGDHADAATVHGYPADNCGGCASTGSSGTLAVLLPALLLGVRRRR